MGTARRLVVLGLVSVLLTLASITVERTRPEVQDWDCPPAPASCARPVIVGGFPLPFVSDYHGISVVGSVGLVGALLGEDHFHLDPFLMNVALYALAIGGVATIVRRLVARRASGRAPR